jgi:NAD(P)H-hydrate epimerase
MKPLLVAEQIRQADAHTISNEPVSSINLMERASNAFADRFTLEYPDKERAISVYCGTGNNGGDGLAIARLLHRQGYQQIFVFVARFSPKTTAGFDTNFERLKEAGIVHTEILPGTDLPEDNADLIIDALLGSGLNKPLSGDYAKLVKRLNGLSKTVVAVDVPTGLFTEGEIPADAIILKADLVITFQQAKISFLLPESGPYIKKWEAADIGLDKDFIGSLQSPYQFVEEADIRQMLKPRPRFSNKGTFGHALIIAGKPETMGAALLCSTACAYTGAGLTTACIPKSGLAALNTSQPEIMAIVRKDKQSPEISWDKFSAIGIGPGLGKDEEAKALLTALFKNNRKPAVIDADALNILAADAKLLDKIPPRSIITPHMKEFDRLFGDHNSWWQRLQTALKKAAGHQLYIVLKNDYTITITPEGKAFFNSTSNAAMASGGMGDVLTGVITSLLAQRYTPEQACIAGVYIHGKAGDELAFPKRMMVVLPGQLAMQLPQTMAGLLN